MKNYSKMTKQEIFDKSYIGLVKQGKKSETGSTCVYYHEGMKCAVGQVLSDKDAEELEKSSFFEDKMVCDIVGRYDDFKQKEEYSPDEYNFIKEFHHIDNIQPALDFIVENQELLASLQLAHDRADYGGDFTKKIFGRYKNVAEQYGLNPPPPPEKVLTST
jgi:hypothetical protein